MRRSTRLFEIIQILRASGRPVTAAGLAERLEVSERTIYRDIAALQAMRTPIEGEAGIGYVIRKGYDLPPLNFDPEEVEALFVGLSLLARTGDCALQRAATRVSAKIEALHCAVDWLRVARHDAAEGGFPHSCVSLAELRDAVRNERKLRLVYRDEDGIQTERVVRPVAVIYHLNCVMIAAWCELRGAFRHFRVDRIWACEPLDRFFRGEGPALRRLWKEQEAPKFALAEM